MKRPEYIGISGVVNQDQQAELIEQFDELGLSRHRTLQLGVKATHKTQFLRQENKYEKEWYPVGSEIDDALRSNNVSTGVAQIYFDEHDVERSEYREEFLGKSLGNAASKWLTGVQFDMLPWYTNPDIALETFANGVYGLADHTKDLTLTLQCQGDIMNQATPSEIVERLVKMPQLDYVLFDASCGKGLKMDAEKLLPYIDEVYNTPKLSHLNVAVGGGLNGQVVRSELPKILRHFPQVSWDAEGQLHPIDANGKRPLDMPACRDYLENSVDVISQYGVY